MYIGAFSKDYGIAATTDMEDVDMGYFTMVQIFFIVYIMVCSFFVLNMFVGVVIATYNREKEKLGGGWLVTDR